MAKSLQAPRSARAQFYDKSALAGYEFPAAAAGIAFCLLKTPGLKFYAVF
jgi:hypothetical protein